MKNVLQWGFSLIFTAAGIAGLLGGHILPAVLCVSAGIIINPILINKMGRQSELGAKDISVRVAYMPIGIYWIVSIILFAIGAKLNPEFVCSH